MAFWGATVCFCSRWPMQGNELRLKKKVSTKKTSKISKKSSPRASDTGKGSYKHNAPDLWGRVLYAGAPLFPRFRVPSVGCSIAAGEARKGAASY